MAKFSWNEYMSAWNTGNVEKIAECYAEDAEVIGAMPQPIRGKDAIKQNVQTFFRTFSDVNGDAEVLVASGEYVSALLNVSSQHTGTLDLGSGKPVPATNKRVKDKLAVFLQLNADGKIQREWNVMDRLSTLQQLGITPPAASASGPQSQPQRR